MLRFESGAIGVIEASTACAPGFPARIEVSGERGTAVLEGEAITAWRFADADAGDAAFMIAVGESELGSGANDPKAISAEGHRLQIADMTRAILSGERTAIDGAAAKIPVELICGIYESMHTGRPYFFKR